MKFNGIGEGVAKDAGFIEMNNSSRALNRKKLVLGIMHEQNYIDREVYYFNSLLPLKLSSLNKKEYGLASYFTEDVRSELLSYKQSLSYNKINYILSYKSFFKSCYHSCVVITPAISSPGMENKNLIPGMWSSSDDKVPHVVKEGDGYVIKNFRYPFSNKCLNKFK